MRDNDSASILSQAAKAVDAHQGEEDATEGATAVHASYDYLMSMAIYSLTWEKVQALEEEANQQVRGAQVYGWVSWQALIHCLAPYD